MPISLEPVAGSLLSTLDPAGRGRLLNDAVRRKFGAGDVLYVQGDPSSHVLIVSSGWVRVSVTVSDGRVVLLALRGPGDVVGEIAALTGRARSATVRAIVDVEALQLTAPRFVTAVAADGDIAFAVIRNLAVRLRESDDERVDAATLDAGRRLAAHLHRLGIEHSVRRDGGLEITMPLTQQDLADRIGASRRAVARSLGLLRERGVVRTDRRRIVILRADVLRAVGEDPHD